MNYTIDAKGKKLGRLASEIAVILQGKKSVGYEPRLESEAMVTIENVGALDINAKRLKQKIYYRHTTQIGHLKKRTLESFLAKKGPAAVLRETVMGMLPKNKLRAKRMKKLAIK